MNNQSFGNPLQSQCSKDNFFNLILKPQSQICNSRALFSNNCMKKNMPTRLGSNYDYSMAAHFCNSHLNKEKIE